MEVVMGKKKGINLIRLEVNPMTNIKPITAEMIVVKFTKANLSEIFESSASFNGFANWLKSEVYNCLEE
jgi:hypothetical protein